MIVINQVGNIHVTDDLYRTRCDIYMEADWRTGWAGDESYTPDSAHSSPPPLTVDEVRMSACWSCFQELR